MRLEGSDGPLACTPANVLKAFKDGNICVMAASDILPPEILRLSLPVLRDEHGDSRLVRTMAQFLSPTRLRCVTAPHPPDAVTDAVFYGVGASQMETGGCTRATRPRSTRSG